MTDANLYRIKAGQRDLIKYCGGIERVVALTDFSKSQVGRWNNPADGDLIPMTVVMMLEAECGFAVITAIMAEANGRRISEPETFRKADIDMMASHAEALRHGAEVANAIANAIADGVVTPAEAAVIDRALSDQEKATSTMRQALAVIKSRGGMESALKIVGD